jgi:hypothetical protein
LQKYADYAETFVKNGGTAKTIALKFKPGEAPSALINVKITELREKGLVVRILP